MNDEMIDYSDRQGDYIITATGKRFYPIDPREEDICIEDIAHSLAMLNRYMGHTRFPYSVAQHCWLGSHFAAKEHQLAFLLHDASEAYVNDVARPVKRYLPDYQQIEDFIQEIIGKKYGVDLFHEEVKTVDTRMLVTEAPNLCTGEGWWLESGWPEPFDCAIEEWPDWKETKQTYLKRFAELDV